MLRIQVLTRKNISLFSLYIQNKNKYFFAGAKSLDRTIEALFAEVDLNGDGKIQPSEFDIDLA